MATEYCQLLSTAHRVLDGKSYYGRTKNNRKIKRWLLSDDREDILMKASHVNHPSNIWVRESKSNYMKLYKIYMSCLAEYTHRYGKIHGSGRASMLLMRSPTNIKDIGETEIPQAMPEYCKVSGDAIAGYRNYYINEKAYFANWKSREIPIWFKKNNMKDTMTIC